MKLLIYSHAFAPQVGGVETFTARLASGLAHQKSGASVVEFDVVVVTKTRATSEVSLGGDSRFEVVRRPARRRLWRLIGDSDRVLLAGPAILPLAFALLRRKPVVVTHHGYQAICPNGLLFHLPTERGCPGHFAAGSFLECLRCNAAEQTWTQSARLLALTFVRRALCRFADFNVGVSEHTSARLQLARSQVIRNGAAECPSSRSSETPGRREWATPPRFAYVGRLVAEKGASVLIQAAHILKERGASFQVRIVGDGPQRGKLEKEVCALKLNDRVTFLGARSGGRLEEDLAQVSAIVMPAIYEDPAPIAALEQMMKGRLIIAAALGGLAEEVGDTGLTFPAGDARGLADQMQRVIEEPELVERLGNLARRRALQNYSAERMLHEYRELLTSCS